MKAAESRLRNTFAARPRAVLFALAVSVLVSQAGWAAASSEGEAPEAPRLPIEQLAWLVGSWNADFLPHGPDRAAPTMIFEWGPGKAYLRMQGSKPGERGGLVPEHETFVFWNPVSGRFEFRGIYHDAASEMLEEGHLEPLAEHAALLHMKVHYAEGQTLPFSDGAVAGRGGHTLEFRRTLRLHGDAQLRGTFFIKRGGRWENPHPQLNLDDYSWSRAAAAPPGAVPAWVTQHLESLVQGSGRWVASNARYVSDTETDDAYGLEWKWTLGKKGVRGRLFGLRDGAETGTYWQFRTFWHPAERRLVAQQFGADGAFGSGTITDLKDGATEIEQRFYASDGTESVSLHRSKLEGTTRVGSSFAWLDGAWQPRRTYSWKLSSP